MERWRMAVVLWLGACRAASFETPPSESGAEAAGGEFAAGAAPSFGAEPRVDAGAPPAVGDDDGEGATASSHGGDASTLAGCGAQTVTLDEIHSGRVRGTVPIAVGPLVASSQKFLVSEAKSGSCLWGAFAADPRRTGAGSGLFLVSYGEPHAEGEACLSGSDGLPDDVAPGDLLTVEGRLDEYVPAACEGTAPALQLRIDVACPARREGATAPPEAAVLDGTIAERLANGKDAALLRDWSGALVSLQNVVARQDLDDGDAVFPFGVIRLEETALEVHSRLYYFDLSEGGPRAAVKAPHFFFPTTFQDLRGVLFLDYCTWVLAPRDRCADLSPASDGCAVRTR
jgi:hypothetical protein